MRSNLNNLRLDLLVLTGLMALAFVYTVVTSGTYLGKSLIAGGMFILPAVAYLGWRKPKPWRKIIVSALLFGLCLGFFFEFIQEYTRAYNVVSLIFPKLLGVVPVDNILGHFMMALLMVPYFFLYFVIEIAAVHYSWWIYPGNNHIGWVTLPGLHFPFEELFYWMLFYAVALTAYYKSLVDRTPNTKT